MDRVLPLTHGLLVRLHTRCIHRGLLSIDLEDTLSWAPASIARAKLTEVRNEVALSDSQCVVVLSIFDVFFLYFFGLFLFVDQERLDEILCVESALRVR